MPREGDRELCRICEWRPVLAKGRCRACYMYRHRTGRDRPEELIVAHGRRVAERLEVAEEARRIRRAYERQYNRRER